MPEFTPIVVTGIILLGGVIGFLSGLFGVGGGFLLSPMLNIVFGIRMPVAIGSGLCQMIGTATTAMLRHWKNAAVDVKLAAIMLGGSIVGVEFGARALEALKHAGAVTLFGQALAWDWLVPMCSYVVLLLLIGVTTFRESLGTGRHARITGTVKRRVGRGLFNRVAMPPMLPLAATEGKPVALVPVILLSVFIGALSGFLGIGGGVVIVPILIYWVGTSTRFAVGTSLLVILINAVIGTVAHALRDNVSLTLVCLLLVSSTLGASLGAALHHRLKAHQVRLYLSLLLFVSVAVILGRMLAEFGVFG